MRLGILCFLVVLLAACAVPSIQTEIPEITQEQIDLLCRDKAKVDAGGFSLTSGSYPCEIVRTYEAIEATKGRGFWMGDVPRAFLKVRLVTKGMFAAIFGLVGLG